MTKPSAQIQEWTSKAVADVFQGMLSLTLSLESPESFPVDTGVQIIGSVGFTGEVTGIIYLYASVKFAQVITSRMLGIEEAEVDPGDMVNDAIGELSNMVVGYVKSRLCDGGLPCTLTIPSVVRGQQLSVESVSRVKRKLIGFRSSEHQLIVEMLVKE
jgi:chemotaxis protein CheX